MSKKLNWGDPKTKADYYLLTMLVWGDIARNELLKKEDSKYANNIEDMLCGCPLCEYTDVVCEHIYYLLLS